MNQSLGVLICATCSLSYVAVVAARLSTHRPLGTVWFNVVAGIFCVFCALEILCNCPITSAVERWLRERP